MIAVNNTNYIPKHFTGYLLIPGDKYLCKRVQGKLTVAKDYTGYAQLKRNAKIFYVKEGKVTNQLPNLGTKKKPTPLPPELI